MSAPTVTVVIVASDSSEAIERCHTAMDASPFVELIVVARCGAKLRDDAPNSLLLIEAPPNDSVHVARKLAFERARGEIVVFTEDSCLAEAGWLSAWSDAFADPAVVAGTGVVESREFVRATDWAVFSCEYAPFLPPLAEAMPARLAGNNFAVRRSVFLNDAAAFTGDEGKVVTHALAAGRVVRVPYARVTHVRSYAMIQAIRDRWVCGLDFGRGRAEHSSMWRRSFARFAFPAIWAIQILRLIAALCVKRRHVGRLIRCAPLTLMLLGVWSAAECVGWGWSRPNRLSRRRPEASGQPTHRQSRRFATTQSRYSRARTRA